MEQKVITVTRVFKNIDDHSFNVDDFTADLNAGGWIIKQIVSTSFNHKQLNGNVVYPVMALSLLVEKAE